jgi:hypothetical protein
MANLGLVLQIFAFVCFCLAAFVPYAPPQGPGPWNYRLLCLGLAFWVGAEIFGGVIRLTH